MAFFVSQCWAIPVFATGRLNWGLWPTPSDFVWLAMLPLGVYLFVTRTPANRPAGAVRAAMVVFVVYSVLSWGFASVRLGVPLSQVDYLAYTLFRLFQSFTVWAVAAYVPLQRRHEDRVVQAITFAGLVVAVAAILEGAGILDYRVLVAHLPADAAVSGAWAPLVMNGPDAALGTLNYNRIYTAHFLGAATIVVFLYRRFSPVTAVVILLFLAGMLLTQSRSALIYLLVGLSYALFKRGRFHSRAAAIAWSIAVVILTVVAVGFDPLGQGAIAARADTFSESLYGRFEIQESALPVALQDPLSLIFGVGLANVGLFLLGKAAFSPAHGQYVTALAELGACGLVLMAIMYFRLFRFAEPEAQLGLAARAVLIGTFASAFFNDLLLPSPGFGSYLAFILCLVGIGRVHHSPRRSTDEDPLRTR